MDRPVPRDLLPLPLDPLDDVIPRRKMGRHAMQRLERDGHVRSRANETVNAVNFLWDPEEKFQGLRPSAAQVSALDIIVQAIRSDPPPPASEECESPEASLIAMLGVRVLSLR
jgi:hypothetical protein